MSPSRPEDPPLLRQAIEGIGIVTLGTLASAAIGYALALLAGWAL